MKTDKELLIALVVLFSFTIMGVTIILHEDIRTKEQYKLEIQDLKNRLDQAEEQYINYKLQLDSINNILEDRQELVEILSNRITYLRGRTK